MKKRLLAALLASAMALSLAACGNTDTGADNGGDAAANGGSSNEPVVLKMNSIKLGRTSATASTRLPTARWTFRSTRLSPWAPPPT